MLKDLNKPDAMQSTLDKFMRELKEYANRPHTCEEIKETLREEFEKEHDQIDG